MNGDNVLPVVIVTFFGLLFLVAVASMAYDCSERKGAFVRSAYGGYVCVERR